MYLSTPYYFTAPDGSTFVLGNSDAARADPNWVGYLNADDGITGLLDGADVAASMDPRVQIDGAIPSPGYLGARAGTINGYLDPNLGKIAREAAQAKMKVLLRKCQRSDGVLSYTPPDGSGFARMLRFRNMARPDFRGRQPTTFMLTIASADVTQLGTIENYNVLSLNGVTFRDGTITNYGDTETWLRMRIQGPAINPFFNNFTNGDYFNCYITLAAGDQLFIFPERTLALKEVAGVRTDVSSAIFLPQTRGGRAAPGLNNIRYTIGAAGGAPSVAQVYYRNGWA